MDHRELSQINKLLKSLKEIQKLQRHLKKLSRAHQEKYLEDWASGNKHEYQDLSKSDLEVIREKADYDQKEWEALIRKLNA